MVLTTPAITVERDGIAAYENSSNNEIC
jgi:hypothetical protein